MYQVLVFIHIVCAIIWVGGALFATLLSLRVQQSDDPDDLPKFGRNVEYLGTRVFLPASLLLFIAGVIMVVQQWSFGQLWISVSMGLWLLSVIAGAVYVGPRLKKTSHLFETEGPSSAAARELMGKIVLVSRLELVSFAIIVALMVFKPGAGSA